MVFPYYPRPKDDEQEPDEEQQQDPPSYLSFYLPYVYPAPPAPDPGYVTPGKPHTPPSGPTTHPTPQGPVSTPEYSPPTTVSGPGYVMPGTAHSGPTPGAQSSGQGSSSKSDEQGSVRSSQAEDSNDADRGKDETRAQDELPDFEEAGENRIDPADIKFYLAAQQNSVLKELQLICQQEKIPSPWKDRPVLLLWLCAEYGIDEENDAEAREYLDHITNRGSHQKRKDDPLNDARDEALKAFETTKADESLKAYTLAVEQEYGVEFTVAENADEWNLANIVMAHAALEMAASVFGDRLRDISGIDIDDATAFRLIFGPLTINHSTEVKKKAHAEVFGPLIEVYWKQEDRDNRNYNLYPYVLLHELGHRFNFVAGLGGVHSSLSINENIEHPRSRGGMGASAYGPLDMVLGVPEEHGMYSEADLDAAHVQSLQYGAISDHNEVTADAVLNWIAHQATGGESGFADTASGQKWLDFMDKHMEAWIKSAIVFNAHTQGKIASLAEEGLISPIAGTGTVIVAEHNTATVRSTHSQGAAQMAHLRRDEEVLLLGESEPDEKGYRWNAVWAQDIYWVRSDLIRETWTGRHPMTEEKAEQWFPTLLELLTRR